MRKELQKLPSTLIGVSGEYFVAAELSIRGFAVSLTLRNTDSIDLLATNLKDKKYISIQVKTNKDGKRRWILGEKSEKSFEKHYYIFVSLKGINERPEYFIVPSNDVATAVKKTHKNWLKQPGKNGKKHKDVPMRRFEDINGEYLEKWSLLK
ncbi:MAG: aspartate ammonia-lyase [Bacteriodetes bacterium]|nr:aspartate ammonia-lyase [Bacteroidota bacterium]